MPSASLLYGPFAAELGRYVAIRIIAMHPLATQRAVRQVSFMADHPNIKPDARQLVESLPDSATWDDLAYEVYVRQAIELGLADADAGRTVEHDEAMARIRGRIRRAS